MYCCAIILSAARKKEWKKQPRKFNSPSSICVRWFGQKQIYCRSITIVNNKTKTYIRRHTRYMRSPQQHLYVSITYTHTHTHPERNCNNYFCAFIIQFHSIPFGNSRRWYYREKSSDWGCFFCCLFLFLVRVITQKHIQSKIAFAVTVVAVICMMLHVILLMAVVYLLRVQQK